MSESASARAADSPTGAALVRGALVVPTVLFALYLTHAASAAILAVGAFRVFSLTAGFTSGAACSAITVLAIAGALGAAFAGVRSRHAAAPMALLTLTEAGFGLAALASVGIFRVTRALYLVLWPVLGHSTVGEFGLRLLLAAGMFALPAALYCATIPILSRLITARPEGAGLSLGFAFGLSLAGSALGLAVALFAFTGWAFLLVWDRTLSFIVGRTLEARATTGAVFLLALALGVFLSSALADRLRGPFAALSALAGAASLGAYASMYLVPQVALFYLKLTPFLSRPGLTQLPATLAAMSLMLPAALFLGAALPLLGQGARVLRRPAPGVVIFFALGIVLADLVIGLLAIPAFGLRRSLSLVSAVGLLAAILFLAFARFRNPTLRPTLALFLLGLMIVLGGYPASWDPRIIDAGLYRYGARSIERFGSVADYLAARQGIDLLFYHEGKESSVMVERTLRPAEGMPPEEVLTLTVDGKVEATTGNDIRTQVLQGHIPVLVHGPTETVLQIDFLDGITAGSVLRHPVKSLTVIEREPALFEASKNFASYNNSPVDDPRLLRVVDAARARLLAAPARYDVILVAGLEPWLPQSASLVTTEGLALLKDRLNSGGLVSLRVPLASTGEAELRAVMRSFARVFPSILVFRISDEDLLLLGSVEPLSLDAGWFRNVISSTSDVSHDLHRVTVIGANEILYTFRLAGDGLRKALSEGPLNDDDHAAVEFASARDMTVHGNSALVAALEEAGGSVLPHLKNYGATPEEKADFLYNLAKSYLGIAGDPVRAKEIARELQSLGQTVQARWVMGEALMQQADVDGALGEWRGVLEVEPGNLDALFSLGTYFMDSRDYWKAEPYLDKAARTYADVSIVRYNHGRNLFYLRNNKEAIAELKEARRINLEKEKRDGYPLVDYLVGVVSHRLKNDKEAAASLETYLKWAYTQPLTRVEVDAHLKLAEVYDVIGKRFDAHKQRQKGEDLLRRLQGEASQSPPAVPTGGGTSPPRS